MDTDRVLNVLRPIWERISDTSRLRQRIEAVLVRPDEGLANWR